MQYKAGQYSVWVKSTGFAFVLLFSCLLSLVPGAVSVSVSEVFRFVLGFPLDGVVFDVLWSLRLPRVLLAASAGMGLALSGVVMQAMFRNPMASPYIMGISSGASLGAVVAVFFSAAFGFGAEAVGVGGCMGALVVSLLLASLAGRKRMDSSSLLIAGVALGAACGAVTGILIISGAGSSGMDVALYWMMGSVAFAKVGPSFTLLLIVCIAGAFFMTQRRVLNLMLLGREAVIPLGRDLRFFYSIYLVANAILVGSVIKEAGLIGFIGLIVPHFVRILSGGDHRDLVPMSFLGGGVLAVWADGVGRFAFSGAEIPLGVSLSLIGAPLFIYMLIRSSRAGGGRL